MSHRTNLSITIPTKIKTTTKTLIIPLSFFIPVITLYLLNPNSFQEAWKGRAPYIFFLWLLFLELALTWRKPPIKPLDTIKHKKALAILATAIVPTLFIVCTYILGLNREIMKLGEILGVWPYENYFLEHDWIISFEYVFFTTMFSISILLIYGIEGLKRFAVSLFFLGSTSFFYMVDTFYPYSTLTVLQSLLPLTTSSASQILSWMGYTAIIVPNKYLIITDQQIWLDNPILLVVKGRLEFSAGIYWPCAGIHSLILYTLAILLFLKGAPLSLQLKPTQTVIPKKLNTIIKSEWLSPFIKQKTLSSTLRATKKFMANLLKMAPFFIVFIVGATGTYVVNILRIVSICIIGVNNQATAEIFHYYYGELFFIGWVIAYPLTIIYAPRILQKLHKTKKV